MVSSLDYAERVSATAAISRANFDAALGPLKAYLADDRVQDISVNPDASIWVSRGALGKVRAPETMSAWQRETLIGMLANRQGAVVDRLHSRLAGDFPSDYYSVRFQAFAPPVADWALCLRCHASHVVPLADRASMMTGGRAVLLERPPTPRGFAAAIAEAIELVQNVGIVGRPGAGKTSLLNSLLQESARLRPDARLVSLEDRREIQPSHADTLQLYAKVEQANPDGSHYGLSFPDLLADSLRTSFDILAFGELRDGASALALLMAMNTGVSGLMFTLHATSAVDALARLEDLVRFADAPTIRRTIARFVQTLVFLAMDNARERRVAEVVRVWGVDHHDDYLLERVKS